MKKKAKQDHSLLSLNSLPLEDALRAAMATKPPPHKPRRKPKKKAKKKS